MKRVKNKNIYNNINNLKSVKILTGWGEQARYSEGISIGYVMYLQNQGYKYKNIIVPARPFMNNCILRNYNKWKNTTDLLLNNYLNGKINDFKILCNQMSLLMSGDLTMEIKLTNEPPNSPRTIKKKGFNKPLIDSGIAFNSVTSEVIYV